MPALSRDEFDSLEFDAAASGDHAAAARQMSYLAATGTETAGMPRAEAYVRAGEQWLLADDPGEAVEGFQRAMADGGPVFVDPRVPMARALFQLGRQTEAQAIISQLKAAGRADPRTCDLVAELLVERSELAAALDWATAGVELCLADTPRTDSPSDASSGAGDDRAHHDWAGGDRAGHDQAGDALAGDYSELRLLLRLRYRIRNDLGLPEDDYDAMLDET
ncbi:MAG: tetratricopeptide repeat protein [Streptosporangiaceae bacterium]